MATIKLRVNDNVLDKVIWLLKQFKKEEVEIIEDDEILINNKAYLKEQLTVAESDIAVFYSLDELDKKLENILNAGGSKNP